MTEEMKAAIAIRPDYAEAHYMLGVALKQSGDLDAALSELKEAIRLDPSTRGTVSYTRPDPADQGRQTGKRTRLRHRRAAKAREGRATGKYARARNAEAAAFRNRSGAHHVDMLSRGIVYPFALHPSADVQCRAANFALHLLQIRTRRLLVRINPQSVFKGRRQRRQIASNCEQRAQVGLNVSILPFSRAASWKCASASRYFRCLNSIVPSPA